MSATHAENVHPRISRQERDEIELRNMALLESELLDMRILFESRPYEAHVQFSNVCNMSCIMCWDGDNPPHQKMSSEVLEKLSGQIAPTLSVITPHHGSEPTIVSWEETVRIAREYGLLLLLTTNMQVFDEQKFHEVKDHVELIAMSIDSHIPELFEKIRPGAKPEQVYRNLKAVLPLCAEHDVENIVQIVFMTENASTVPETLATIADMGATTFGVIQMIDVNRNSSYLDPTLHFSAEYIDWIKRKCVAVAKEKRLRLGWNLSGFEWVDFRDDGVKTTPRKTSTRNQIRDDRMRLRHPGFCKCAYGRLLITAEGHVSPCSLDSDGELVMGSLAEQDFEEIWNGATAQDLRRAHYTWDYPTLCKTCRYVDLPPAKETLPFLDHVLLQRGSSATEVRRTLVPVEPPHMARLTGPPTIRLRQPETELDDYVIALSLGGELEDVKVWEPEVTRLPGGEVELAVSAASWSELRSNAGYWWTVLGSVSGQARPLARSAEIRCLIRHEEMTRIEDSNLKYPDDGRFAVTYLGGNRQVGWSERGKLPVRPPLRGRPKGEPRGLFASRKKAPTSVSRANTISAEAYHELVGQVREVARSALPPGATVVVVSRGDERLLALEGCVAGHFPAQEDGAWSGFHPRDDEWAIGHLEHARDAGAQYLLIPASALWWLDHYVGLAEHLRTRYSAIVEDAERCAIFDLQGQ